MGVKLLIYILATALYVASFGVASAAEAVSLYVYNLKRPRKERKKELPDGTIVFAGLHLSLRFIFELPFLVLSAFLIIISLALLGSGWLDWGDMATYNFGAKFLIFCICGASMTAFAVYDWYKWRQSKRGLRNAAGTKNKPPEQ